MSLQSHVKAYLKALWEKPLNMTLILLDVAGLVAVALIVVDDWVEASLVIAFIGILVSFGFLIFKQQQQSIEALQTRIATLTSEGREKADPEPGSWESVSNSIVHLVKKMRIDGFQPDVVVMYGRGGAVMGALLAGNLGNVHVMSIDRNVVIKDGSTTSKLISKVSLRFLKAKSVLVVTGEVVTGNQLRMSKDAVLRFSPKSVKTASYYVCNTSSEFPNYYYLETSGPTNVPWRILSDYKRDSKPGVLEVSI